jgi:cellulose synthase operon protein C
MTHKGLIAALCLLTAPGVVAAGQRDADAALIKGVQILNAGKPRDARVNLLNAIKESPDWGLAHAVQGRIYLVLGDGAPAEAELRLAISNGLPEGRVRHLLAHALLLQGMPDKALNAASADKIPARYAAYAARIRGKALVAQGNFEAAGPQFDLAAKGNSNSSELWTDVGEFKLAAADMAGAIGAAQRAVKLDPRNFYALMLAGRLSREQFGLIAAIPWFERAHAIDPQSLSAMLELAATYGDAGRARDMLAMTRKVLEIDKANNQAFYLQAVLAARAGKPELARGLLYRTGEGLNMLPAAMLLRAVIDLQSGNSDQAISQLRILIDVQPDNVTARRLLGSALWRAGDADGTIETLKPIALRADADSYTLSIIGRAYEQAGDAKEAAGFLDRAASPERGNSAPFDGGAQLALLARANAERPNDANTAIPYIRALISSNRSNEALGLAENLQNRNPGVPAARVIVGDALAAQGRLKDAINAYQSAANIQFAEPVALRLIDALRRDGQDAAALRVLDLFLIQNPRNIPAQLLISEHLMATAQWARAIDIMQSLRTRIGDRDVTLLNNLAWAWFMTGDARRALPFARAAYALSPSNPAITSTLGWIMFKSGVDKSGGADLLAKAVAIAPNHPGLRYQLGQAYADLGNREKAKTELRAALAVPAFGNRTEATALLGRL